MSPRFWSACRRSFKVIRHVRPKLSCAGCERIVQAPAPSRPIERGLAGPGLLAHVLVSKYCDHLPLYRQSEIYAREGVELERSTLADWVGGTSRLLEPLVEALRRYVHGGDKLHADDTPVPVLAPGNGKTKTGRLWTYVRDDRPAGDTAPPAVWFAYSPDPQGRASAAASAQISAALCRPMPMPDSIISMRMDTFRKRPAGRTSGASSTTCRWRIASPTRRRSPGTHRRVVCHRRRDPRPAAGRAASKSATLGPGPCWSRCISGWKATLAKLSRKSDTAAAIHYALARWRALAALLR